VSTSTSALRGLSIVSLRKLRHT